MGLTSYRRRKKKKYKGPKKTYLEIAVIKKNRATHCAYCFKKFDGWEDKTIDHKKPRSRGGNNHWHNLTVVCKPCNLAKGSMKYEEYKEKVAEVILTKVLKEGK